MRHDTIRRSIIALLAAQPLSARQLSEETRVPEKEILEHLEHIRTGLHDSRQQLIVTPPVCRSCGFQFRKRQRLAKPGKCPVCHEEWIEPPVFSIG